MAKKECLKGWVLAPSPTDGSNVPFFIYVRDKDIIWDENHLPKDLKQIADLGADKKVTFCNSYWKYKYKNWSVQLNSDYSFILQQNIVINNEYSHVTADDTITISLDLPFSVSNDDLNVNITKVTRDKIILNSFISYDKVIDANYDLKSINIYLSNPLTKYVDEATFKNRNYYNNSSLDITITGIIQ